MKNKFYIGIETIYRDVLLVNYGSIFQHYALRRVVEDFGFSVFRCEHDTPFSEIRTDLFLLGFFKDCLRYFFRRGGRSPIGSLRVRFLRWLFMRDYRRLVGRVFERQPYDESYAFIAGGDSVWCRNCRSDYLLDKPASAKRISYAASSAWDKCSENQEWCKIMHEVSNTYSAIGVRENAGREVISRINPKAGVEVVLDPVMLLERDELLGVVHSRGKQFNKPTLLYYAVNIWDKDSLNLDIMIRVADRMGCELKIVGIQGAENYLPEAMSVRPSPTKFLSMVRDADYFVTNSFHGVVFSIVLGKRFAFISQGARRFGDQNCRQRELLDRFSLTDRMLNSSPSESEVVDVLMRGWSVPTVHDKLAKERNRCKQWLKEALK